MYSQTARLLIVLELLQSHDEISGAEIAKKIEVSRRTVRRYIVMLQDMGIPIEADQGRHGAYRLQRGYEMPPLLFTESEATAMTLGLLTMQKFHFPVEMAAVEGALAKVKRSLPEKLIHQAQSIQENVIFNTSLPQSGFKTGVIESLSTAIQQHQQVRLAYISRAGDNTERVFDPYGIVFNEGYWYAVGYCHLRQDLRLFRLDRIVALEKSNATFDRPKSFDLLNYVHNSIASIPGPYQVEIVLKTSIDHARQVIPPDLGTLHPTNGGVVFRREIDYLEWLAYFLLNLNFPVIIAQPAELRDMLRHIGNKAIEMAG
ncbi:MAG: YafY family transcriptional regulator [Anaerolineae bacterium]|nr:YafY family transcriptional regulator [Anaerolineae bacterium]